jgi:hypothetical protein
MGDSKQSFDGEHDLPTITADLTPDSVTIRQSFSLHLFQTLNLSDGEGAASLEKSIKIAIARRRRALNDKNSPLLRLPAELIVAIGHLVMTGPQTVCIPDRRHLRPLRQGWKAMIGNFMHASSRLRQDLDMVLNSTRVSLVYQPIKPSQFVKECGRIKLDLTHYRGFSTKRPRAVYMSLSRYVSGSTAAAFAAFVECEVLGGLQTPPVVYAQAKYKRKRVKKATPSFRNVDIGYARELSMRRMNADMGGR